MAQGGGQLVDAFTRPSVRECRDQCRLLEDCCVFIYRASDDRCLLYTNEFSVSDSPGDWATGAVDCEDLTACE